ncbi:hypothetical protein CDAR_631 [Caerostris darwini]|uniref:Uncharacterized protein n=1 Tax=Caerostris darwini TaxID=1538125 RepID=A0AAV4UC48_9ARAC|nr:hypothetical protein CDAR_631 [Caerostris darwini]
MFLVAFFSDSISSFVRVQPLSVLTPTFHPKTSQDDRGKARTETTSNQLPATARSCKFELTRHSASLPLFIVSLKTQSFKTLFGSLFLLEKPLFRTQVFNGQFLPFFLLICPPLYILTWQINSEFCGKKVY